MWGCNTIQAKGQASGKDRYHFSCLLLKHSSIFAKAAVLPEQEMRLEKPNIVKQI